MFNFPHIVPCVEVLSCRKKIKILSFYFTLSLPKRKTHFFLVIYQNHKMLCPLCAFVGHKVEPQGGKQRIKCGEGIIIFFQKDSICLGVFEKCL